MTAQENREPRTKNQGDTTGVYSYRGLIVWQKAQELAVEIIRATSSFPKRSDTQVITNQIVRSATSIGANIAEGHGRYAPAAHKNHLSIAKASAAETGSWLDLLRRLGHIDPQTEERLNQQVEEIMRILVARMRQIDRISKEARQSGRIGEEMALYLPDDYFDSAHVLGSES